MVSANFADLKTLLTSESQETAFLKKYIYENVMSIENLVFSSTRCFQSAQGIWNKLHGNF